MKRREEEHPEPWLSRLQDAGIRDSMEGAIDTRSEKSVPTAAATRMMVIVVPRYDSSGRFENILLSQQGEVLVCPICPPNILGNSFLCCTWCFAWYVLRNFRGLYFDWMFHVICATTPVCAPASSNTHVGCPCVPTCLIDSTGHLVVR